MIYRIGYSILYLLTHILYRIKVIGKENYPSGTSLVCANHTSNWDPILLLLTFGVGTPVTAMAKAELFRIPILKWILPRVHVFPVHRDKTDVTAIKTAFKELSAGKRMAIFPQGGRKEAGNLDAKAGAGMFAVRSKAPIVPVYISPVKKLFHKVYIVIGKPYYAKEEEHKSPELYQEVSSDIMSRIYALGLEDRR